MGEILAAPSHRRGLRGHRRERPPGLQRSSRRLRDRGALPRGASSTRPAGGSSSARAGSRRSRTSRERAISMSIRQILKSREILCIVPDERKAQAVRDCLELEVSPLHPASILQDATPAPRSISIARRLRCSGAGASVKLDRARAPSSSCPTGARSRRPWPARRTWASWRHPDDLEILAWPAIRDVLRSRRPLVRRRRGHRRGGAPRAGPLRRALGRRDARDAAGGAEEGGRVGEYGVVVLLDYTSAAVKTPDARGASFASSWPLLARRARHVVYTHNLADRHDTHVATALAAIEACRALPAEERPGARAGGRGLARISTGSRTATGSRRTRRAARALARPSSPASSRRSPGASATTWRCSAAAAPTPPTTPRTHVDATSGAVPGHGPDPARARPRPGPRGLRAGPRRPLRPRKCGTGWGGCGA